MDKFVAECVCPANATLGEGPSWYEPAASVLWLDILSARLLFFDPKTGENRALQLEHHVGSVVPARAGDLIAATQKGFVRVDPDTGTVSALTDPEADKPGNRFNDGKCDPKGRFWAGTMAYDETAGAGSLYVLDPDLQVRTAFGNVTISNGLAWSGDGKTLYYIDTPTRKVDAFDYDQESGNIENRRTVIQIPEGIGYPDGMTIDDEDRLWIAFWDGWGVRRWDPGTGKELAHVEVPAARTTACCFGGENLDQLYISSARTGLTDAELSRQPQAGGLFRVDLGIRGRPTFPFLG